MKHTPGEWVVSSSFLVIAKKNAKLVGNCTPTGSSDLDVPFDEAKANAILQSAAPDLLEALKIIIREKDLLDSGAGGTHSMIALDKACDVASAAIAKAEGKDV